MADQTKQQIKWHHRPTVVIIAILAVGPLALPLVWMSPVFTKWSKIVITILLLAMTLWLIKVSVDLYQALQKELRDLQNVYSH